MTSRIVIKVTALLLLAVFCCMGMTACTNLTQENYDKIQMGTTYAEVVKLLGKDHICDSALGMKNCTWGDNERNIKVQFVADKAVLFAGKGLK
jgi:hypothetical protein